MKKIITLLFIVSSFVINAQNIVVNPSFESGKADWVAAGAAFDIGTEAYRGDSAAILTVTTEKYNGINTQNTSIELTPGTYVASFLAKAADANTSGKKASVKVLGAVVNASNGVAITDTDWTSIAVTFTVLNTDYVKVMVRANNIAQTGMVMYVDGVVLERVNYVYNGGFESFPYSNGWETTGATLLEENTIVHSGDVAMKVTPSVTKQGVKATDYIEGKASRAYVASAWIKGTAGTQAKIQMQVKDASEAVQYLTNSVDDELQSSDWQHISIPFAVASAGTGGYRVNFQATTVGADYYLDDIVIDTIPMSGDQFMNGDIELGVDQYYSDLKLSNGAVATVSDETVDVYAGSKAMKIDVTTAGTSGWGDVEIQTSSLVTYGDTAKTITFYAKYEGAGAGEAGFVFGNRDELGKSFSGAGGDYNGKFFFTDTYRKYTYSIPQADVEGAVYALPFIRCGQATGTYYFDNISVSDYDDVTPAISTTAITTAEQGNAYTYDADVNKEGGMWSVVVSNAGELDNSWLTVDAYTGELSGTPTELGTFSVALTFDDGVRSDVQNFDVAVGTATALRQQAALVALYPNPASEVLYVKGIDSQVEMHIYSISGQKVKSLRLANDKIDVSSLQNGIYYLQTENETLRFIINR